MDDLDFLDVYNPQLRKQLQEALDMYRRGAIGPAGPLRSFSESLAIEIGQQLRFPRKFIPEDQEYESQRKYLDRMEASTPAPAWVFRKLHMIYTAGNAALHPNPLTGKIEPGSIDFQTAWNAALEVIRWFAELPGVSASVAQIKQIRSIDEQRKINSDQLDALNEAEQALKAENKRQREVIAERREQSIRDGINIFGATCILGLISYVLYSCTNHPPTPATTTESASTPTVVGQPESEVPTTSINETSNAPILPAQSANQSTSTDSQSDNTSSSSSSTSTNVNISGQNGDGLTPPTTDDVVEGRLRYLSSGITGATQAGQLSQDAAHRANNDIDDVRRYYVQLIEQDSNNLTPEDRNNILSRLEVIRQKLDNTVRQSSSNVRWQPTAHGWIEHVGKWDIPRGPP